MRQTGSIVSLDIWILKEWVKRTAFFYSTIHCPSLEAENKMWWAKSLIWVAHPSLAWEKQILRYEMTSSLIAWDLSPAVVNRDWFTSQAAFLDSKTWFKFAILFLCRRDLKVPWLYVTPAFKVTQQRISPDSANLTFSPGDFYFNKSYSGRSPWCWGL